MPGMQPYKPTPRGDEFKPGDTVQFRVDEFHGHGYLMGQLWSPAPAVSGRRAWWVVREDRSPWLIAQRDLRIVQSRDEQLSLTA